MTGATSVVVRLQRLPVIACKARPGELFLNGRTDRYCYTLENDALKIPAGVFPVTLDFSEKAHEGQLWTPDDGLSRLPTLQHVPGRSGIHIHAANEYYQMIGCIAVGQTLSPGGWLGRSQVTLEALFQLLVLSTGPNSIEVCDETPARTT